MNYLKHIFYYIIYKKYRILVSNTWVFRGVEYPDVLDIIVYHSLNEKYCFSKYKGVNLISIFTISSVNEELSDNRIKFRIDDGIHGQVSAFFMENHKDKLIKPEDKLSYQRESKLKDLGI